MTRADLLLVLLLGIPFAASISATLLKPHARNVAASLSVGAMALGLAVALILSSQITKYELLRFDEDIAGEAGQQQ